MVLCVVFGCSKCSGRDKDVSFYRIPKVVSNKSPELLSLSKTRRHRFLQAISRVGLAEHLREKSKKLPRAWSCLVQLQMLKLLPALSMEQAMLMRREPTLLTLMSPIDEEVPDTGEEHQSSYS